MNPTSQFVAGWLSGFALCLSGASAVGQTAPEVPAAPEYQLESAKEDYRYLATESAIPPDFFDPIKFIPLSASKQAYLSIGGQIREQYQWLRHANWGEGPQDESGYLLQRYMLHADLHLGPHFRVFGELKSGLATGKNGPPELPEEDRLDLHQAFVDVSTGAAENATVLRVGRQEMAYGSSRLVSLREGPNVRQTFDGARLILHQPKGQLDAFMTRPATTRPGIFDDETNPDSWFWGLYGVKKLASLHGGLDLYYLGLDKRQTHFQQGSASERRHSLGTRWWGTPSAWRYNVEAVYQFGRFGAAGIRAWTASGEFAYTLVALSWKPELALRTEFISGDLDPANPALQTFNPLFPRGAYFGQVALVGPANLKDVHPMLLLHPPARNRLTIVLDWDFFWRASRADGFYSMPYVLERPGNSSQSAYIGDQLTTEVDWDVHRHVRFELFLTYFRAGDFLKQTGTSQDILFFSPRVTYRF